MKLNLYGFISFHVSYEEFQLIRKGLRFLMDEDEYEEKTITLCKNIERQIKEHTNKMLHIRPLVDGMDKNWNKKDPK